MSRQLTQVNDILAHGHGVHDAIASAISPGHALSVVKFDKNAWRKCLKCGTKMWTTKSRRICIECTPKFGVVSAYGRLAEM